MYRNTCLLFALVLSFFTGFARMPQLAADTIPKAGDTLRLGVLPRAMTWITPAASFQVTAANAITMQAGKESDLFVFVDGQYYINSATKLAFPPDSDFIFSARVRPSFANLYDGGALLLYSDSSNWASFLFEMNEKGKWGVSSSVVHDRISDGNYYELIGPQQIWLKVVRSGKIFCFYHSSDGKTWTLTRTFPYPNTGTMQLGFYAQSPKGPGCRVEFTDISYRAKKFTDFFTGE